MKKIIYTAFFSTAFLASCNFLDETPQGIMTDEEVKTQIEGLVTTAYSALGNDHYDVPFSLWPYGNVRSDDAYKGGGDLNDIGVFHFYEISQNIQPTFAEPDKLWFSCYQGISRANNALRLLKESSFEKKNERMGEMYFIRGHFLLYAQTSFRTYSVC